MSSEEDAVISAVQKTAPSVVTLSTVQLERELFYPRPVQGMGSGVIVHGDGYIATNYHVVEGSEDINVITSERKQMVGQVVGADRSSDLAVVRVRAKGLPAADLADSDELKVGQTVVAIGSPFGFFLGGPSVTKGVISAVHRDISVGDMIIEDLLQTDAAINPGNSGGPLIDLKGRVVGLSSAMIPYAQGIGFAIPANTVRKIVEDLILYGRVSRSWLGIAGVDVDPNIASSYGFSVERGVGVASVARGGPAQRAGVQPGDVIVGVDDEDVTSMKELRKLVKGKKPGETTVLQVARDGKVYSASVVLSEER
jgi:serine protease Do